MISRIKSTDTGNVSDMQGWIGIDVLAKELWRIEVFGGGDEGI